MIEGVDFYFSTSKGPTIGKVLNFVVVFYKSVGLRQFLFSFA